MWNVLQILLVFSISCIFLPPGCESLGTLYRKKWFNSRINQAAPVKDVKEFWFEQKLDHFNPTNIKTWQQRYFVNDTFYKPGGPILLMIGGEGPDNPLWMSEGTWITYASKLNAFCFSLEHRFYGQSHPTPDLSLNSLIYLTSEQALADLATFTQAMKEKYKFNDNKWIALGGSYPGSLAAWYRLKYPHLVDIAVSTSAPLLAQLNFKEYLGVVTASINRTNSQCLSQIQQAVQSMEGLLKRRTGWWMLQKTFKLCDEFRGDNKKDVSNLFESLAGNFEDIVQYNEDNRAWEGSETADITISTLCDIMTKNPDENTPMERYAAVNNLMLSTFDKNCTDFKYSHMIKEMQQESWNSTSAGGSRQWTYQTCTEFGFFQSSDLVGQPFGSEFGIDFSVKQCVDLYGSRFNQTFIENAIKATNTNYGAKNIKVSKVIFVNGSIDPWHALGITTANATSSDNVVIFIDGTAHCANMYPDAPSDPPQLRAARKQILDQLTAWLKEMN
jgi:pimeloyl-ACP methyl ester carboxylesterase